MIVAAALLAGSAAAFASDVSYDVQQMAKANASAASQRAAASKGAQSDARTSAMSCGCQHSHS